MDPGSANVLPNKVFDIFIRGDIYRLLVVNWLVLKLELSCANV